MAKRYVRKKKEKGIRVGQWVLLAAVAVLIVALVIAFSPDGEEEASAAENSLWDGSWYADDLGRIRRDRPLVKGMKAYWKKTGTRPYLTILEGIDPEELDAFVQDQYEALFDSGDHLLVVYDEWGEGVYYLSARRGAESALTEANVSRLLGCIEKAYADPDNDSYAEAFGEGFAQAARELPDKAGGSGVGLLLALSFLLAALGVTLILFLRKNARIANA